MAPGPQYSSCKALHLPLFSVLTVVFVIVLTFIVFEWSDDSEATIIDSGTCGPNLSWELENDTLTISGSGIMNNYRYDVGPPWSTYKAMITTVIIQEGVTYVGDYAFFGCPLTDISLPDSLTGVGCGSFQGCSSLDSISFPNNLQCIASNAFFECTSLSSVVLPDSIVTVDHASFAGCILITSVTIPSNLSSIAYDSFSGCSSLASYNVSIDNLYYSSENGVLFNKDKTHLVRYPIGKVDVSYTVPDSVVSIDHYAFYDCALLVSLSLPDSVTSIGYSAFCGCSSLTTVNIPEGVSVIGDSTFSGCSSLESIVFPDTVTLIGNDVFYRCYALTSVTLPTNITKISYNMFRDCTSLSSIVIPEGVETIDICAFYRCGSLTSVYIPNSVMTINRSAFSGCTSLSSLTLPSGLSVIQFHSFYDCHSLSSITIPNGVSFIEEDAFYGVSFYDYDGETYLAKDANNLKGSVFRESGGKLIKQTSFTVSFKSNGGSYVGPQIVVSGETAHEPISPSKTGYSFIGWYSDVGLTEEFAFSSPITGSLSLHAKWSPHSYSVSFDPNGGSGSMSSQVFTYDVSQNLSPNTFSKQGYVFGAWSTSSDGPGTPYSDCQSVSNLSPDMDAVVTLYAFWVPITYSVSFDANSGTGTMDNQSFTYDSPHNLIANNFSKQGYLFSRWNTEPDGSGISFENSQSVINLSSVANGTVIVYAQWFPIVYTVSFDANSGTGTMDDQSFTYDSSQNLTANNFSKQGYLFGGWNTASDGSGTSFSDSESVINLSSVLHTRVTLYARWSIVVNKADSGDFEISSDERAGFLSSSISEIKNAAMNDNNVSLIANIGNAVLILDNTALKSLEVNDADLSFIITSPPDSLKERIGDHPVFDISFGNNKDFGEGKLTVTVPYVLSEGEDAEHIVIYYLKDGKIEETISCVYDDGFVTFTTNHLSTYAVAYEPPTKNSFIDDHLPLLVIIGVVVVVIASALFLYLKKH